MANPHKGESKLEVGNVVYNLLYDWDALCSIESELKKPIGQLGVELTEVKNWSAAQARTMLYYGLRHHYPNMTLRQVGDMIAQAGGLTKILPALNAAIGVAFPEALAGDENPTMPNQDQSIGSAS